MIATKNEQRRFIFDDPSKYTQTGKFLIGESPKKNPGKYTEGLFIISGINIETGLRTPFGVEWDTAKWTNNEVFRWLKLHWKQLHNVTGQKTVKI